MSLTMQSAMELALGSTVVLTWSWALGVVVLVWLWWNATQSWRRRVPGPASYPVIGSAIEVLRNWDRLHDWVFDHFSDDVRTIIVPFAFPDPAGVYTVDPANVEYILKSNFKSFPKGHANCHPMREMLGTGIFTSDGELWKEQRKVASYEFSSATLRDFSSVVFREYAATLVSIVSQFAGTGTGPGTGEAFDMQDLLLRMTLDSTCRLGFGVKLDGLSLPLRTIPFAKCFDDASEISFSRFSSPHWKLTRLLNVGGERKLKQSIPELDDFSYAVIEKRRNEIAAGYTPGIENHQSDLLSRFVDLCNRGDKDGAKPVYTDKYLRDMILNFVIAGRDTTAVTLSWFFYMMTVHPQIADKIVDELSSIVTPHGRHTQNSSQDGKMVKAEAIEEFASLLTYETLGKLSYLHASLSETLRLYPAVSINSKEAASDDMLPDGTPVKKGSITGYVPYSMGRMRFLWGDDATEFKPERWLNGNGEYEPQSPFKFSAFQAGPRSCLGKDSAYLQMKMTAAMVLRFFHLHLVPHHPVRYRTMVTLAQRHGLRVTATPRSFVHNPT